MPRAAFVYLHGFASSPGSRKATDLAARFAARGAHLEVPDLNAEGGPGGFEKLTITRMLGAARAAAARARARRGVAADGPLVLLGSSLGGYTAALLGARDPVAAAVLLAPAFEFARRFETPLSPADRELAAARGYYEIPHHAEKRVMRLDRGLITDGLRYEDYPALAAPTLILHGRHDAVVPIEASRRFAADRANVRLVELEDDHLLHATMEPIWRETAAFLEPWLGA